MTVFMHVSKLVVFANTLQKTSQGANKVVGIEMNRDAFVCSIFTFFFDLIFCLRQEIMRGGFIQNNGRPFRERKSVLFDAQKSMILVCEVQLRCSQ